MGRPVSTEAAPNKNKIIHLEQALDSGRKLSSEDIKDLTPNELYSVLFEERRN